MTITFDRDTLIRNLNISSRFTSSRINTAQALQGVYILVKDGLVNFYSTDLNIYCHINEKIDMKSEINVVVEPKKILEFLNLLNPGPLDILFEKNSMLINQGKSRGVFPVNSIDDFPLPPNISIEFTKVSTEFLIKNLPFLLFTASTDDARPVLTGVNFVPSGDEIVMVSTDGFRLSVVKENSKTDFPSMIIPAFFLKELVKLIEKQAKVDFSYSEKDKIVCFRSDNIEVFSRIIDGQFPPYEKVIPESKTSTAKVSRQDLIRNTKLISIFARDYSNVVVYSFSKAGLIISPKKEANSENSTVQEIEYNGEPVKVAFNHKYVSDFLNSTDSKDIIIELLRSDSPVVFRSETDKSFIHVIMPVRIQE